MSIVVYLLHFYNTLCYSQSASFQVKSTHSTEYFISDSSLSEVASILLLRSVVGEAPGSYTIDSGKGLNILKWI
jgi:hypothetical protein